MAINTASGTKIFIGTTADAENLSQFIADDYIEVGEVEDGGEFGDESSVVTFSSLGDGRVRKLKGVRDAGTIELVVGADITDAGQQRLIDAEAETLDYNFLVVENDALTLGGTGTESYFRGKVMSKRKQVGTVDNVVRRTFSIGINTAIIEVPAT